MGFITSLFGGMGTSLITAALALGAVLVAILLLAWAFRFFTGQRVARRGRARRIGVTESVAIDGRRRLLLIRRDDVEHLVLTGGPQDLVIEEGVPLVGTEPAPSRPAMAGRTRVSRPSEQTAAADTAEPEPAPAVSAMPRFASVSRRTEPPPMPGADDDRSGGEPEAATGSRGAAEPARTDPAPVKPSPRVADLVDRARGSEPRRATFDRLRQLGARTGERATDGPRFAGLLRPVTRHRGPQPVHNLNNSPANGADSDKLEAHPADQPEQERSVDASNENQGNDGANPSSADEQPREISKG